MELRHLRYFVAVAEEENVSRAAGKLHVSQPGISRQIRDLEEEIGFPLFERSAKSLRLTAAGKIFLEEARGVLERAAGAVNKARGGIAPPAELNVGYAPSGTVEILPRALRAFVGTFPGVRVTLHDMSVEEMLPQLLGKKLDIALTVAPRKLPRELGMKELDRYAVCVAVSPGHPRARAKFVSLAQMASEPIAAYNRREYPDYFKHLETVFATIGRRPRIGSEHDGVTSLIAAVEAGPEFALVPSCVSGMAGSRMKLLPLRPGLPPMAVVALWRKEAESELIKTFVEAAAARPPRRAMSPAR